MAILERQNFRNTEKNIYQYNPQLANKKIKMINQTYQICTRCVMDTSDQDIVFDSNGVCNHCTTGIEQAKRAPSPEEKEKELSKLITNIKKSGEGKKYDCVVGVSGGVDSSYVAYLSKEWGLRPLCVHLDNFWNTEIADKNIRSICRVLEADLVTVQVDETEFKDIQLSFLKASVPDAEIPSDTGILMSLSQVAKENGVKYILTGVNTSTESIMPKKWSQGHFDGKYIKAIQKRFGSIPLKKFPYCGFWELMNIIVFGNANRKIKRINILNYLNYNKEEAKKVLQKQLGWEDYGGKHLESVYTRFIQNYWLPEKFGFDKRRGHLSSSIVAGLISREEALTELQKELYTKEKLIDEKEYVCNKLGITTEYFDRLMKQPNKFYADYPNISDNLIYSTIRWFYRKLK